MHISTTDVPIWIVSIRRRAFRSNSRVVSTDTRSGVVVLQYTKVSQRIACIGIMIVLQGKVYPLHFRRTLHLAATLTNI